MKRGFEVLALGEMCFEGMGAVEKGVSRLGAGCNVFYGHGGQVKRGLEVLAPQRALCN